MSVIHPSPSIIRAMANTLHDNDVDPVDTMAAVVTLIRAGFPAKLVDYCFDAAVTMALIRKTNEERKT